ncbi:MAG: glycosyltransferase family 39 protein [Actinomycetota bacterium]|nr:glycosyltransferase family 39 protein [Actinomycetota bacterium]
MRALARLERLADRRLGAAILFVLALAVYAVESVGWPLVAGRDLDEYLYGYIQFLDWHPLLPWSMLFRTPVTPILAGSLLDVAGGHLAEPFMAALFAGSVVAWAAAARAFGTRAALLVASALLVYPAYALMFHELSSEPFFAAAFALWALLVARAAARPTLRRFVFVGLGVALLALIRPGNALLLVFALFPFALSGRLRVRTTWAAAFLAAAILPLAAWAVLNGVRFGDYTLARGGNAVIPLYRAFITDRIVSPDNGPASRRLGKAVQQHLLTRDPYKSYGVTEHEVFASGSFRIHEDLYLLSDQVFGWNTDYSVLRKAGIEAVRKHPGKYASGVAETVWQQLSKSLFRVNPSPAPAKAVVKSATGLPPPTEGQPIPAGQNVWISRPDNSIRDVWTSATHHHFVFEKPGQRPRFDEIVRERDRLFAALPDRQANAQLSLRLNQLSRWFPRPIVWITLGLLGLVWLRPRGARTLVALGLAAMLVIVFNALGLFADPHFALPVAPAFILLAAAALLGPRSADY